MVIPFPISLIIVLVLVISSLVVVFGALTGKEEAWKAASLILALTMLAMTCGVITVGLTVERTVNYSSGPEVAAPIDRSCFSDETRTDFGPDCRVKTLTEAEELLGYPSVAGLVCYHGNDLSQHETRQHTVLQPEENCQYGVLSR